MSYVPRHTLSLPVGASLRRAAARGHGAQRPCQGAAMDVVWRPLGPGDEAPLEYAVAERRGLVRIFEVVDGMPEWCDPCPPGRATRSPAAACARCPWQPSHWLRQTGTGIPFPAGAWGV